MNHAEIDLIQGVPVRLPGHEYMYKCPTKCLYT